MATCSPKVKVPANEKAALLISPAPEDEQVLTDLFAREGWRLSAVPSLNRARTLLEQERFGVVITERELPAAHWRDVLKVTQALPEPPLLIVISLLADDHLWAEALNLGAHDVLAKPLDQTELTRVLTVAWHYPRQTSRHWHQTRRSAQLRQETSAPADGVPADLPRDRGVTT